MSVSLANRRTVAPIRFPITSSVFAIDVTWYVPSTKAPLAAGLSHTWRSGRTSGAAVDVDILQIGPQRPLVGRVYEGSTVFGSEEGQT